MTVDRERAKARPLRRKVLKRARSIVGERGTVETTVRNIRNAVRFQIGKPVQRTDLFAWKNGRGPRFGVYTFGGCDVAAVLGAGPALARRLGGTVCLGSFANAPATRSDVILQTLDPPPDQLTADVAQRLDLPDGYFSPRVFAPDFEVPNLLGAGRFPTKVVVLSLSSDISRTLYRHREHGYLVDPGGWWLASEMKDVLDDLSAAKWFASQFRKAGRLKVEDSMANFAKIITEIRHRTGAFVVVMNVLNVDPGRVALDYQRSSSPNRARRREFCLAITDLARELDFPVLDVDRIAKHHGISGQVDFVHYTPPQKQLISQEFARLLVDAGVVGGERRRQRAGV